MTNVKKRKALESLGLADKPDWDGWPPALALGVVIRKTNDVLRDAAASMPINVAAMEDASIRLDVYRRLATEMAFDEPQVRIVLGQVPERYFAQTEHALQVPGPRISFAAVLMKNLALDRFLKPVCLLMAVSDLGDAVETVLEIVGKMADRLPADDPRRLPLLAVIAKQKG